MYEKNKNYNIEMNIHNSQIPTPTAEQGCIRRGYCCTNYPGWFGPGEVEKAAELLQMQPGDFIKKYIVVDGMELAGHGWVDVFAPIMVGAHGELLWDPATRVPGFYKTFPGPCVFYESNGCKIYAARPIECKNYFCGHDDEKNISHEEIARMWVNGME